MSIINYSEIRVLWPPTLGFRWILGGAGEVTISNLPGEIALVRLFGGETYKSSG